MDFVSALKSLYSNGEFHHPGTAMFLLIRRPVTFIAVLSMVKRIPVKKSADVENILLFTRFYKDHYY